MLGPAVINIKRLKFWKKVFNLIKNWSQWGRAILLYRIHRKSLLSIEKQLDKYGDVVCGSKNLVATETMRNYINMHQNVNDQITVIIRNSLRIIQLNYKLNIFFWKDILDPISICLIGIAQNITAMIKIWLKKRYNKLSGKAIQVKDYLRYQAQFDEYKRLR
jgi:hypothetical protein